jgi:hypothetical protein
MSGIVDNLTRSAIDQECSGKKCLIPIFEWYLRLRKERHANINDMSMLSFRSSILLMSMRTRNKVSDANLIKKRIEFLIFTTPDSLYGKNFSIKEPFNKSLKFTKFLKNLRFKLNEINPLKFVVVINKTHIIFIATDRFRSSTPNIRKKVLRDDSTC